MLLISSPRFGEHVTPPGHPERIERATVFDEIAARFERHGGECRAPDAADIEAIARVHSREYIASIEATAGRAVMLEPDTFTSPESADIARLAAGAAVEAARLAWSEGTSVMALVRPPGHHAESDRAMGFCLYNNVAVAAAALRAAGADRVAIVDIDVHHGNGTQWMFYSDPTVLYVSTHQYPFYPGTGAASETGAGPGTGFTLNLPLPAGTSDDEYADVYASRVVPALEGFRPDVLLVSAGYDAHVRDPLGGMRLSTAGFVRIMSQLSSSAARLCGGRSAWITEGGYHLEALEECLDATIDVLR